MGKLNVEKAANKYINFLHVADVLRVKFLDQGLGTNPISLLILLLLR